MFDTRRGGFLALYQRNIGRVYQICRLHMKNAADAEDAAQAVFLDFLRTKPAFQDEDHEKAWFITAARSQSRDMIRTWWLCHRADNSELEKGAPEDDALMQSLLALQGYDVSLLLLL